MKGRAPRRSRLLSRLSPTRTMPRVREAESKHESRARVRIVIRGAVQRVGFRPFVFRLAEELRLDGWVSNTTQGVVIDAEGSPRLLEALLLRIEREKPVLSQNSTWPSLLPSSHTPHSSHCYAARALSIWPSWPSKSLESTGRWSFEKAHAQRSIQLTSGFTMPLRRRSCIVNLLHDIVAFQGNPGGFEKSADHVEIAYA